MQCYTQATFSYSSAQLSPRPGSLFHVGTCWTGIILEEIWKTLTSAKQSVSFSSDCGLCFFSFFFFFSESVVNCSFRKPIYILVTSCLFQCGCFVVKKIKKYNATSICVDVSLSHTNTGVHTQWSASCVYACNKGVELSTQGYNGIIINFHNWKTHIERFKALRQKPRQHYGKWTCTCMVLL